MTAVRMVRENTDELCHSSSCCDSGCWLSMDDAPEPNVLLNLEHEASPIDRWMRHCDFLFVGGGEEDSTEMVAPIELTTGPLTVKKFLPQLQEGASLAERLIPMNIKVRFRPVAVYGKDTLRKAERKRLLKEANFVEFRGIKTPYKRARCGSRLADALNS